jgi:hypothetical protein
MSAARNFVTEAQFGHVVMASTFPRPRSPMALPGGAITSPAWRLARRPAHQRR